MRRGVDVGHRVDVQVEQAVEREELRRVPVVDARVGREVVLEDVHSEAQHEDRAADAEDGQHEDREELEAQVWQQGWTEVGLETIEQLQDRINLWDN